MMNALSLGCTSNAYNSLKKTLLTRKSLQIPSGQIMFISGNNAFLTKKEPLWETLESKSQSLPDRKSRKIGMAYRSYQYTFSFMTIVVKRILDDVQIQKEYWHARYKSDDPDQLRLPLTKRDRELLSQGIEIEDCLQLDIEDFFIHANILMDKVCKLACLFLGLEQNRSFSKHKSVLKKLQYTRDEEYREYVLRTDWYEQHLKNPRDDLIVHSPPLILGSSSSHEGLISVSKFTLDREGLFDTLRQLGNDYSQTVPELHSERNMFEICRLLVEHRSSLTKHDTGRLDYVLKQLGFSFPSIDRVSDEIFDYLAFVSYHRF